MKEYTVYVHKNLKNDKYYVGMTCHNPKKRWDYGWGYKNQPKMWKDIQESDWNKDWVHGILGKFENEQDALKYEAFLIAMLDSVRNGYNTSSYDSGKYNRTEETRRKMSESLTGHEVSEVTRNKISESLTGRTLSEVTRNKISESLTGRTLSEEHRKKMSEAKTGNHNARQTPVLQFTKEGKFINEYSSLSEAERQTGCDKSSICSCCKGKLKSVGGYLWRYAS